MCIIVEKNAQTITINREWHDEFWSCNPHGFGVTTFDPTLPFGERVQVAHTMDKEAAWAIVDTLNNNHADAIVHYRQATHGATGLSMCHPFVIETASAGIISVTHNGMLSDYPTPPEFDGKTQSDTYAFVRFFLEPALRDLDADRLFDTLRSDWFHWQVEAILGNNNRLVITDQFGHVTFNNNIWHTKKGGSLDGVRLSNTYAWSDIDAPKVASISSYRKAYKAPAYGDHFDVDFDFDAYSKTMPASYTPPAIGEAIKEEALEWIDQAYYLTRAEIEADCIKDPELVSYALHALLNQTEEGIDYDYAQIN